MQTPDGRVQHAWRDHHVTAAGLLDDQAAMARATLALFEATGDAARLAQARTLADAALAHFADADGSFFTTADDAGDLPAARPRSAGDNVTPSGNAMMAEAFARLYHLTGETKWRGHAEAVIRAFTGAPDAAAGMSGLLAATDLLENASTIVVSGAPEHPLTRALLEIALRSPDPATCVLQAAEIGSVPALHPAYGKGPTETGAAAYVCRAGACSLPVSDPAELRRLSERS